MSVETKFYQRRKLKQYILLKNDNSTACPSLRAVLLLKNWLSIIIRIEFPCTLTSMQFVFKRFILCNRLYGYWTKVCQMGAIINGQVAIKSAPVRSKAVKNECVAVGNQTFMAGCLYSMSTGWVNGGLTTQLYSISDLQWQANNTKHLMTDRYALHQYLHTGGKTPQHSSRTLVSNCNQ